MLDSAKIDKLKGHVPDEVINEIKIQAAKFNINSSLRLAHFLAQCAHESTGFKDVTENLRYKTAKVLMTTFPKIFHNASDCTNYLDNPAKLGAKVYANKNGNGDEASGDGYRYRGRGYIQLTGKANYQDFKKVIGDDVVAHPDLVATKYPLASAAFYFNNRNGLWAACDKGATDDDVKAVTKLVNGGFKGLAERTALFKKLHALL